jgi:hypothetical protein
MINGIPVHVTDYEGLLSKFPEVYRDKLRVYTGEELFYMYKLALFNPKPAKEMGYKSGDILYMALKQKMFRWLKGEERYGIHPHAWRKLGSKFKYGFLDFVQAEIEEQDVA